MQKNIKTFHLIHDKYLFFCIVNTLIEKEKSQNFHALFKFFWKICDTTMTTTTTREQI